MSHATTAGAPALLLDVSRLIWRLASARLPTGIDRVCLAYVEHYHSVARAVVQYKGRFRILNARESQRLFALLRDPPHNFKTQIARLLARTILASRARSHAPGSLYLNVGHTGLDSTALPVWLAQAGVRPIFLVHDLIPLTHPEYCRAGEEEKHRRRIEHLLHSGAGVIGNSADTITALTRFAALRGLPMPATIVAPLGAGVRRNPSSPPRLHPYFVMLGTIEGRKNHLIILNLWRKLAARLGGDAPHLVIIGQRGWESEQAVDMLERCTPLRSLVTELPECGDAMLCAYLEHARALLFPSFVEGYGMPLIEALDQGTPVIASDLPVFRELVGDIPDYLSPIDGLGWLAAISDYAQPDSAQRAAQIERMRGYRAPDWGAHFGIVDNWLATLAG